MRTIEPCWRKSIKVWWAYTWRTALWIIVPAMALFALPVPRPVRQVLSLANVALVIWSQIFTFKSILRMDFSGFSVRLVDSPSK